MKIHFLLSLVVAVGIANAQNPDTDCATKAIQHGLSPGGWYEIVCIQNACESDCGKSSFSDGGGWTWTYCSCNEGYSSSCCQLFAGEGVYGELGASADGSCEPNCGIGGSCGLELLSLDPITWVAECD